MKSAKGPHGAGLVLRVNERTKMMIYLLTIIIFIAGCGVTANKFASPTGCGTICSSDFPCSITTMMDQLLPGEIGALQSGTYAGSNVSCI